VWRGRGTNNLSLSTNFTVQNRYDPTTRLGSDPFSYVLSELAGSYASSAKRALIIGLGVGLVPRELAQRGVTSTVIELDSMVPPLAAKYFDFDPHTVDLRIGDGRRLLHELDQRYDVVILDAFHGDSTPSHLLSREAFEEMADLLSTDGVLLMNSWSDVEGPDQLMPVVLRTLRGAFQHVRVFDARLGNYYVVASNKPLVARVPPQLDRAPEPTRTQVRATLAASYDVRPSPGLVLTDDFNPADTLAVHLFESVRRRSAGLARPQ
jgi:SAM-dependent methyltransferase